MHPRMSKCSDRRYLPYALSCIIAGLVRGEAVMAGASARLRPGPCPPRPRRTLHPGLWGRDVSLLSLGRGQAWIRTTPLVERLCKSRHSPRGSAPQAKSWSRGTPRCYQRRRSQPQIPRRARWGRQWRSPARAEARTQGRGTRVKNAEISKKPKAEKSNSILKILEIWRNLIFQKNLQMSWKIRIRIDFQESFQSCLRSCQ